MKKCSACGVEKELGEFGNRKSAKDGLTTQCKNCKKIHDRKYYKDNVAYIARCRKVYYKDNVEYIAEYHKEYYKSNVEHIAKYGKKYRKSNIGVIAERNKKYRQANPVRLAERKKKYYNDNIERIKKHYEDNKDIMAKRHKRWIKNNLDKCRAYCRKRRAQRVAVAENYTKADEDYTRRVFQNRCFNCGSTEKICVDHNNPLSKGFALTRKNAVLLCFGCNSSKYTKIPAEFYSPAKLKKLKKILDVKNA